MNRLLHRIQPHRWEDAQGFLKRVSTANHLRGTKELLNLIAGNKTSISLSDCPRVATYCLNSVPEIAQLSGIDVSRISGQSICQINGELITKSTFVASRSPKVCPECLYESPYLRGSWLLTFYTACPFHQKTLVNRCSQCKKLLKWDRRLAEYCSCGFDLRLFKSTTSDPESTLIALLIERRQNQSISINTKILGTSEIQNMATLSIDGLCKTIWFLGHCITNLGSFGAGQGRKVFDIEGAQLVIYSALKLLRSWPNELGQKLDLLAIRQPLKNTDSLINRLFGPVQHYLRHEIDTAELFYLRTAYEQHIRRIWSRWDAPNRPTTSKQMELDFQ